MTRRGKLTLALLCAVAFLDFVDASITNVALPSIRHALHFSVQGLQWVPSGYLLTYGGFMLLGSLAGSSGLLVGARLAQGIGAAMMLPAALSILTTSFKEGKDRHTALGVWGSVGGLASAAGALKVSDSEAQAWCSGTSTSASSRSSAQRWSVSRRAVGWWCRS
ncbi:MAG TPA: hypothetical protein VG365_14175, partial [Solirubrobacteraceae bacterium]|nr:hypothetical protein [Solirubrobacteraceae bacterium]